MIYSNQKLAIFGDNEYAISMILETLHAIHQKSLDIDIVINRDFKPKHPFNEGLHRTFIIDEADFVGNTNILGFLAGMSPESRNFLLNRYEKNILHISFPALVHPSVYLPYHIHINKAVRIEPNATIAPFVEIGKAVFINRGAIIGHHTTLGDFVNINPGAIVNGKCRIGSNTTIGAGTIVNDGINIGANCIIGSGSLVTRDIPDNTVAYGSPAKVIKTK